MDFAQSNTYLKVIIQFQEPKIFNEKVEILFNKLKKQIKPQLYH